MLQISVLPFLRWQKSETVEGRMSDRAAHVVSPVFTNAAEYLSPTEVGMGDGNYRGVARADNALLMMCVPNRQDPHMTPTQRNFNSEQRRVRVVVENTIGQVKKWKSMGSGAFNHRRDFEKSVFDVCVHLTARIMRVRDRYPRSARWLEQGMEEWEAKLGIYLWLDPDEPGFYLIHNLGEE